MTIGIAVATAAATCVAGELPASAAPAPVSPAVVSDAASSGGRVIVTLKDHLSRTSIRSHGAQRRGEAKASQGDVLTDLREHGATSIRQLVSVNAVAARVSTAEVRRLRRNSDVARITRDLPVSASTARQLPPAKVSSKICPTDPGKPLLEPEALGLLHVKSDPAAASDANKVATGKGVRIGMTGVNGLAGNPNFIRPNGQHVVVDSPTPNADDSDVEGGGDEWYGDASSISGQGTVTYDFSQELPYSNLPSGCTFRIEGVAPGASLVDTGFFGQGDEADTTPKFESEAIAGLDHAAIDEHVSVVSESYGFGAIPGETDYSPYTEANDELVAAGITVVESSGDSGVGGTVEVPANDPLVIDAGATTAFRLDAQAFGYSSWQSNQMAALSSGGITPNGNVVDLVATGDGGEATCSPAAASCPQTTLTEAFGGTSQSAPFIAGAAADVIEAYASSHHGEQPTPALVKRILTGTSHDIGATSDDQGSGLLDVGAAVRAAQQQPDSTVANSSAALIPQDTQLDVSGAVGSKTTKLLSLYNASSKATTVHSSVRYFDEPQQFGKTTTESVSAPPASAPLPAVGAKAANDITMAVPAGIDRLGVDMITPNPKNDAILDLLLFDPQGRLSAISYDYSSTNGQVSNNQHVAITKPMAGTWKAKIVWNNGRSHLQDPPPTPGNYRGNISVRFTSEKAHSTPVGGAAVFRPHSSLRLPVPITFPTQAGDSAESVQFTADNGATTSVPIARRTLIPAAGTTFGTTLGSSVARDFGPLKSWQIQVPAGKKDLRVTFQTADTSADNTIDYFLVAPNGIDGWYDRTANTTPQGAEVSKQKGTASIVVAHPPPGLWTVQTMLDLTTSGKAFTQQVTGRVDYDTARVHPYNIPNSATTTVAPSGTTLQVAVTNTTGVGRQFYLATTNGEVAGAPKYLAAGSTVLLTGVLKPDAASGAVVKGTLAVVSVGSPLSRLLVADQLDFDDQTLFTAPYQYEVGAAST